MVWRQLLFWVVLFVLYGVVGTMDYNDQSMRQVSNWPEVSAVFGPPDSALK